jgi:3-oxoacyl-[acyl-carrier protein] reductase
MDLGLKDKVAMVTGASRGIGRATAEILAQEGAILAICSRTEKEIKETAKKISDRHGVKVHAEAQDLTRPKAIENFVSGSKAALGRIDILVNNVGAGITKPFEGLSEKDWQDALEKNFWVALRCCRVVIPIMKEQGGGNIINLAALSGKIPRRGQIGSNVGKAALINLTESLAVEFGSYGIRVNAICPAAIFTERWVERVCRIAEQKGRDYDTTLKALAREQIPVGRFGAPEDVGALAVFLASDKSGFINGVSVEVDGGLGRSIKFDIR